MIIGLTGVPKYYKGRLSEEVKVEPNPFNLFSKYKTHYKSECTGSAYIEWFDDTSRVIIDRLNDVLDWCSKDISTKCLYQEYLVMIWLKRYVNYALPTAYLNKSRINTAMEWKNIIRNRSFQEEKNIEAFVTLAKRNIGQFPYEDWEKYVKDAEIKKKMNVTREAVEKKLNNVIKMMPRKRVIKYEIDFKNCAGYTPSPF